jgi:hypothetical protein
LKPDATGCQEGDETKKNDFEVASFLGAKDWDPLSFENSAHLIR